jgi:tetratricopeptide (TPR) repeat protein
MCAYLDFGKLTQEQMPWLSLLEQGSIGQHDPEQPPVSYMCQPEWTQCLKKAAQEKDRDNWFVWLQLGLNTFIEKDYERAGAMLQKSVELQVSPWALYALSILNRDIGNHEKEVSYMLQAWKMRSNDVSLAKQTLRCLYENHRFDALKTVYEEMSAPLQEDPRCKVYYAFALVDAGDLEGAEQILYQDGGILIPDIRECETITLDLWLAVQRKHDSRPFLEGQMASVSERMRRTRQGQKLCQRAVPDTVPDRRRRKDLRCRRFEKEVHRTRCNRQRNLL